MARLILVPSKAAAKELTEQRIGPSSAGKVTEFNMAGETFKVSKTICNDTFKLAGNGHTAKLPKHISSIKAIFKDHTIYIINDCKKKD